MIKNIFSTILSIIIYISKITISIILYFIEYVRSPLRKLERLRHKLRNIGRSIPDISQNIDSLQGEIDKLVENQNKLKIDAKEIKQNSNDYMRITNLLLNEINNMEEYNRLRRRIPVKEWEKARQKQNKRNKIGNHNSILIHHFKNNAQKYTEYIKNIQNRLIEEERRIIRNIITISDCKKELFHILKELKAPLKKMEIEKIEHVIYIIEDLIKKCEYINQELEILKNKVNNKKTFISDYSRSIPIQKTLNKNMNIIEEANDKLRYYDGREFIDQKRRRLKIEINRYPKNRESRSSEFPRRRS